MEEPKSEKDFIVTLLLCLFVGYLGAHRFYAGKTGTALIQLFTLGCFGIWTLIDFIKLLMGRFEDKEGCLIKQ